MYNCAFVCVCLSVCECVRAKVCMENLNTHTYIYTHCIYIHAHITCI